MGADRFLIGTLLLLSLCSHVCAEDEGMVAYKPDIVGVDRMFLVALNVPTEAAEIAVRFPESVTMFDRTPLPAKSKVRKYYFRALKAARRADITFAHPGGEVVVSIEIWSFDDLREYRQLKEVQLPRRWPLGEALPELKQGQTTTTERLREFWEKRGAPDRQRRDTSVYRWLAGRPHEPAAAAGGWLDVSDEQIWDLQPDSTIPRTHCVNLKHGCPVHGTEIYRHGAFYPWGRDVSFPYRWKLKCPVAGEEHPSNDFASGDMTSGEFPDDGIGGACEYEGNKYGFTAEICQAYCHQMLRVAPECADGYLATGDIGYAHKALVAFCRLAVEYAYLATMTQHRHRNKVTQVERLGPAPFSEGPFLEASGFTIYYIDQPAYQWAHAEAYDNILPAIDKDPDIIPFLQSKGYRVETHEDVRRFIEENLFAVWMQGAMDGATHSNQPYPQRGLARMAEVLNYERGDEFLDWLYDGAGNMRVFVPNGYFRDGAAYEATGGYNSMHVKALGPIVESVEHLRQMRPDVYPEDKYPNLSKSLRYHNVFDFSMNIVNIDRNYVRVGDVGEHPQYRKLRKLACPKGRVEAFEHAYKLFKEPKFAWALVHHEEWEPSVEFPYTRAEMEAEAAKWPDDWNEESCLQDGYGVAMLRSGKGDEKRALWLRYGRARGHTHDDIMHIGMDAYQSEILGQLGYPRNAGYWERTWMTHNLARQMPFVEMTATAQLFADAGPVHVGEAYAEGFIDRVASGEGYEVLPDDWQRRMLAIIDVSEDQSYYLDFYRISGGEDHWWTFHVQEGEFTTEGLELRKQDGGTLAGQDVPYASDEWFEKAGCRKHRTHGWWDPLFGFPHLYDVERDAPDDARPSAEVWSADWELKDSDGLHFRLTVPRAEQTEVIVCNGKSPVGGSPYEMKWVLQHKQGDTPVKTQILSAMELYRGEPVIGSMEVIPVSGEDEGGFAAWGVVIHLPGGTDTVFASADGSVQRTAPGGFEFAGRFGLYREREGRPAEVVLVGGTRLTKNGVGITQEQAEYRAEISSVDRERDTVTVSPAPADPAAMVGKCIYITSRVRRIACKVLEAKEVADGAELRLEFDSRIGTGKVTGVDGYKIMTATPFHLQGFRYYHGARLENADGSAEYQLAGIRGDFNHPSLPRFALIDSQVHPDINAAKLAQEFPEGSWFDVYDYGCGDEVSWPVAVSASGG